MTATLITGLFGVNQLHDADLPPGATKLATRRGVAPVEFYQCRE